jgi:hypothetical protein
MTCKRGVGTALAIAALSFAAGGDDACDLPADPGPCEGLCERWHFDAASGLCEEFTWGCCEGNANNFVTQLQCQASCACELPMDIGPCDGVCPRWYYDATLGRCELFMWGCCGGNANNFETQADCENACATRCAADVTVDGLVGVDDLIAVLSAWGEVHAYADVDGSGLVDVDDLVAVVVGWGPCA